MLRSTALVAALLVSALAVPAVADPVQTASAAPAAGPSASKSSPFMRVYGSALPPYGFVDFCERTPYECRSNASTHEQRFDATPQRLSELDEVNRDINRRIQPATDADLYGVQEFWTLPVDRGDCEDYALQKRHELMRLGWPASALLLTVVRDERGDGHAVLTVRTAQGDFVLDNKAPGVKLWHQTGYRFLMRQSFVDPKLWMSLSATDINQSAPATAMPARR